jgi:hypothetical protein
METMKDPNFMADMKLQRELAARLFRMRHQGVEGNHSDAAREWAMGEDNKHVPARLYREVLSETGKQPAQIALDDEQNLDMLAKKILERFESGTLH